MYLTKIYVENFGVLHDYEYTPEKGLNQLCMENGKGKTTLAVFLRAMFYGMPQTRTRKILDEAERKKYKPWQGGIMGGYVCFEKGDKSYRLIRTFGSREREDTFKLIDERTGNETDDYSVNIGEELFGSDREGFTATAWISGRNIGFKMNDSLYTGLGFMREHRADDTGEMVAGDEFNAERERFEEAVSRLEDERRQYERTGQRGLIYELRDKISRNEALCEQKEAAVRDIEKNMSALYGERSGEVFGLSRYGVKSGEEIAVHSKCLNEIKRVQRYINTARAVWVFAFLAAAACTGFAAGASERISGGAAGAAAVLALATGTALLIADIFLCARRKKLKRELEQIKQKLSDIQADRKITADRVNQKTAQLEREKQTLAQETAELKIQRASLADELERCRKKSEMLQKTVDFLKEAKASCAEGCTEGISAKLLEYAGKLDEELASKIMLNSGFEIQYEQGASFWELDYLSFGQKDLLWLCERLAVADSVYSDKETFLVLDEPFVNFDDEHIGKAKALIRECAEKRQIFYFTCRQANLC